MSPSESEKKTHSLALSPHLGMYPEAFFFLCIVGRESPRDSLQHTAVKTANSGYMYRCLLEYLESISLHNDGIFRNR